MPKQNIHIWIIDRGREVLSAEHYFTGYRRTSVRRAEVFVINQSPFFTQSFVFGHRYWQTSWSYSWDVNTTRHAASGNIGGLCCDWIKQDTGNKSETVSKISFKFLISQICIHVCVWSKRISFFLLFHDNLWLQFNFPHSCVQSSHNGYSL